MAIVATQIAVKIFRTMQFLKFPFLITWKSLKSLLSPESNPKVREPWLMCSMTLSLWACWMKCYIMLMPRRIFSIAASQISFSESVSEKSLYHIWTFASSHLLFLHACSEYLEIFVSNFPKPLFGAQDSKSLVFKMQTRQLWSDDIFQPSSLYLSPNTFLPST